MSTADRGVVTPFEMIVGSAVSDPFLEKIAAYQDTLAGRPAPVRLDPKGDYLALSGGAATLGAGGGNITIRKVAAHAERPENDAARD